MSWLTIALLSSQQSREGFAIGGGCVVAAALTRHATAFFT
jgi:hypothetical protein